MHFTATVPSVRHHLHPHTSHLGLHLQAVGHEPHKRIAERRAVLQPRRQQPVTPVLLQSLKDLYLGAAVGVRCFLLTDVPLGGTNQNRGRGATAAAEEGGRDGTTCRCF